MTRKRFIKLLMSQGVQRNDAEKYARERIKTIKNYEFLYFCFLGELMELFLEKWEERLESSKRDCFPDEVPYGFPEFLYRLYGEGEQSERN